MKASLEDAFLFLLVVITFPVTFVPEGFLCERRKRMLNHCFASTVRSGAGSQARPPEPCQIQKGRYYLEWWQVTSDPLSWLDNKETGFPNGNHLFTFQKAQSFIVERESSQ